MVWGKVRGFFQRHPRTANAFTGMLAFGGGDVICQELERISSKEKKEFDKLRFARTAALGMVMNGVVLYQWYHMLDVVVGASMNNRKLVLIKMAADQFIYAPFAISVFFTASCVKPENLSLDRIIDDATKRLQRSFVSTYLADCLMWPAVNFATFSFIPLHFRPTFVGVAQVIWQTYMSYAANTEINSLDDVLSTTNVVENKENLLHQTEAVVDVDTQVS